MYIKQIIIQGFKSYKDQTVVEPFSPKHNVIVGRNGSGKSNFFAAIRFVLSDAYTSIGREERQALLHEGSGSAVMSAYVEIIFDNSDERFPTGKNEVILRRTIGLKKDEYSLDRKNATKSDIMNLLESAGFSRSNPYYIVPQGRVTALTNMKDPERLTLLKEVAGTQVYEARRLESLRIMSETDSRRTKIDGVLAVIRDRLGELEEEKEELRAYQEKDRERRCLQYTIYNRESEEIIRQLEGLEEQRAESIDDTEANRDRFIDNEKLLSEIDTEIRTLSQKIDLLGVDKKQTEDERRQFTREKAQIELELSAMSDGQTATQLTRTQYEGNLQEVQSTIHSREQQLAKILPAYQTAKDEEAQLRSQLDDAEATKQRLYAKQGRNARFKNKTERDGWLRKEIDEVNIALARRKAVSMQTEEDVQSLEKDILAANAETEAMRQQLDNRDENTNSVQNDIRTAKEVRDRLQDQRKELWREEAKLDQILGNTQQELDRSDRSLSHMMDQNTSRGVASVRRIKRQHNLEGVYGTLAELFETSDKYKTAVEVTAGNSLFHYVVDNEETATKVLEILNREKAGRVTFIPLNRLRPKPANMPKANDAIEMITRLRYDPKYEKAFQQVFGKTIICPNLQIASQYARSNGVSAITPDGDRADKKGALTGGFHDPRNSRLDAVHAVSKWRTEYDTQKSRRDTIRIGISTKDQEVTRAVSDLQKAEQRRQQTENSYVPLQQNLRANQANVQNMLDAIESKKRAKSNVEAATRDLAEQQGGYETELASEFKKVLSQDEETQLEVLLTSVPGLRRQFLKLSTARADQEAQKSIVEVELRENLRPRLDQLRGQKSEISAAEVGSKITDRQNDLKRVTKLIERSEKTLRQTEGTIDEAQAELVKIADQKSNKQTEQEEIARLIERYQKRMTKNTSKKSLLQEKATEATLNIRNLGVLPEDAFADKYTRIPSDKAIKRLHAVNESLKKYSHVNKKAYEQYSNFTRQRDSLNKRRGELGTSYKSIQELIEVLDQRKDEAIERTFKQVSKEFASIFERLVPAGRGRLIIQRKSDRPNQPQPESGDESEDEVGKDGVENYTGVGISVSFNSKHDEQQRIQQLSGGQKSLCALALVFSIQRCDPAPFYLFDEIDANLDAQYRTAVAALLQEISQGGQFICTTFRPEMLHVAEKCYGVTYGNKTSSIDVVDKEDALKFIDGQISAT